jgi:hypothetical protein
MDYVKLEPDADNDCFLVPTATSATVTEMEYDDHLELPIFCPVKRESRVRFICIQYVVYLFHE